VQAGELVGTGLGWEWAQRVVKGAAGAAADVADGAAVAELHANPQCAPLGEAAKIAHDPLRVALLEHLDLGLQLPIQRVALGAVLQRHSLDCHLALPVLCRVNGAVGAFADLVAELEIRRDRLGECRHVRCNGAQRLARLKL